jgi:hypothetical protein
VTKEMYHGSSLMLILFMRLEVVSNTDPLLIGIDSGVNTEPLLDEGAGGLFTHQLVIALNILRSSYPRSSSISPT